MSASFPSIYWNAARGRFKGQVEVVDAGINWTSDESSKEVKCARADIRHVTWTKVDQKCEVKVVLSDGKVSQRFYGFPASELDSFVAACKSQLGQDVDNQGDVDVAGFNFGKFHFEEDGLKFTSGGDGAAAFEIPYGSISQAVKQGKNNVAIVMSQPANPSDRQEFVSEVRVFIPSNKDKQENDEERFEVFQRDLQSRLTGSEENVICSMEAINFLQPRGKYGIDILHNQFKLHGKSYSHTIKFEHISRFFLLQLAKGDIQFIVSLKSPLRQGNTAISHLIMVFKDNHQLDVDITLPEKDFDQKYAGQLAETMKGPAYDIVSRLFKALTPVSKVVVSGEFDQFQRNGDQCLACNLKSNQGSFFPLKRSFFFVPKPSIWVQHKHIQSVVFGRVLSGNANTSSRNFDFHIHLTSQGAAHHDGAKSFDFSGFDMRDFPGLFKFLEQRDRAKSKFEVVDEEQLKEQLRRMESSNGRGKRAGAAKSYKGLDGLMEFDDDDEDSEDDEDFGENDAENEQSASDDEEYESLEDDDGDDDDQDDQDDKEKDGERAPKRKRADSDNGDDDDQDEVEAPKKKKQKPSKKKKKKDPNAPKRGITSYLYFGKAVRAQLREEFPEKKMTELSSVMGARWKELSADDRKPYEEQAALDRERYQTEMAHYSPPTDDDDDDEDDDDEAPKKKKTKAKAKKDPNAPKRGITSYFYFGKAVRAQLREEFPEKKMTELSKVMGARWKELSADDRKPYEEQAALDKERYLREMETYEAPAADNDE